MVIALSFFLFFLLPLSFMEVLSSGGYDLLPVPFNRDEVLRQISLAFRKWWDGANALKRPAALKAVS
jgi:hypothetical protein